jgi:hypothetical protein
MNPPLLIVKSFFFSNIALKLTNRNALLKRWRYKNSNEALKRSKSSHKSLR